MRKRIVQILCLLLCILFIAGCGEQEQEKTAAEGGYELYYLNEERTRIEQETIDLEMTTEVSEILEKVIGELFGEGTQERQPLLPEGVSLLEFHLENQVLWLNFNDRYEEIHRTEEVLIRAAMVRTCVQIPDVDFVGIRIEGTEMKDSYGEDIGLMDASTFVENSGNEINTYQMAELTLFFANSEGNQLVHETRSVYYNTSMSLERVIMEQLLKGPRNESHRTTIPTETKILGVTVADNVCYVNLSQEFSDTAINQPAEIPIYSIVNSLVNSGTVDNVQISVNGESNIVYRENIRLNQLFGENKELIEDEETE